MTVLRRLKPAAGRPSASAWPGPDRIGQVHCVSRHGFHKLSYRDWGNLQSKDCVICVHGLTRNACDFDPLAARLSSTRRVVAVDLPGRGQSDWLSVSDDYNLLQYNMDMTAVIARTGYSRVDWIGTSLGGLIGIVLAGMAGSPIRRLIINDVAPEIPIAALRRITSYVDWRTEFSNLDEVEAHLRKTLAPFGPMSDADWARMARTSSAATATGYRQHFDPGIIDNFRRYFMFMHFNLWKFWDQIPCPVLILRGTQSDFLNGHLLSRMVERLPHADVIEFDGVGHTPTLNHDCQIDPVANWLDQTAGAAEKP